MNKKNAAIALSFIIIIIAFISFGATEAQPTNATKLRCELIDTWLKPSLALNKQWDESVGSDCYAYNLNKEI